MCKKCSSTPCCCKKILKGKKGDRGERGSTGPIGPAGPSGTTVADGTSADISTTVNPGSNVIIGNTLVIPATGNYLVWFEATMIPEDTDALGIYRLYEDNNPIGLPRAFGAPAPLTDPVDKVYQKAVLLEKVALTLGDVLSVKCTMTTGGVTFGNAALAYLKIP